jgi:hypothetical protein
MRTLARRVSLLERQPADGAWGVVPIVEPDRWPEEASAAYEGATAAGDWRTVGAIVETQTGVQTAWGRRGDGVVLIEVRHLSRQRGG